MLRKLKIKILSIILFHANRYSKDADFYEIKNRLLARFGKPVGYDLQEIAGKQCFHCCGTGKCKWFGAEDCWYCTEEDYDPQTGEYEITESNYCGKCGGSGWFKDPQRNLLLKMQFGRFVFHQPIQKLSENEAPENTIDNEIRGYVEHQPSKYGKQSL